MPNVANFRDTWRSLEPRGQLTLVVSALLVLVTAFLLYNWASKPTYTALESGLDPARTAKVTSALDSAGVAYRIENGGTQVSIREGQESQARIALAESGAGGAHAGWDLFDSSKLGTTDFENQVKYQRALEGEIATTLEGIDGISAARVQLVLPRESLFADDSSQASASVTLEGGSTLDSGSVQAVAHVVKGAVQGLDAENVIIVDETGALLWPAGDDAAVGGATQLQQEQRYDARLSAQVDGRLAQILGPGKALSQVHADLNMDKSTVDSVEYGTRVTPLSSDTETETLAGGGTGTAQGPSGTASNVPPYTAGGNGNADAAGGNGYERSKDTVVNAVDKTVTHTDKAPGEVEKLSIGLVVDSSVKPEALQGLEDSVAAMVGLDPARGDTISVTQMDFPEPEEVAAATADPAAGPLGLGSPIDMAKTGGIALGLIAFLFLMRRSLRRREGEEIAQQPTWLREIEATMPIAQLEAGPARAQRQLDPDAARASAIQQEAGELVRNRPEHLAAQVQEWMNEG